MSYRRSRFTSHRKSQHHQQHDQQPQQQQQQQQQRRQQQQQQLPSTATTAAASLSQQLSSSHVHVWVRSEVVEAIHDNHGTLPKNFRPKKRSRHDAQWGWARAQIVQANQSIVTITVNEPEFPDDSIDQLTVTVNSNDEYMVCNCNTWWQNANETPPSDLCSLVHLHEPAVVYCLYKRYQLEHIYTYTGKILLALNPFRSLPGIYGPEVMQQYFSQSETTDRPPPHIYAIAHDAYRSMMQSMQDSDFGQDQSILVSGESGAGKTVTTKIIMGYLATLSQRVEQQQQQQSHRRRQQQQQDGNNDIGIESQVLQSNPILESFGNARTVRNDNSSRFGKYIEIAFLPTGSLVSASIETYLLEKVRLITQAPGERNYHIFYEILTGMPQRERHELRIANASTRDFKMTCQSGVYDRRDGVDDRDTYRELRQAMDTVGFAPHEQIELLSVAAALLHTSNLSFNELSSESCELIMSNPSLRSAVSLLGVPQEALSNAFCLCAIEARGETFFKNMSIDQATKAVEAFIKATYGAMFTYIVRKVNASIAVKQAQVLACAVQNESMYTSKIGVLDIFGFESFQFNSFEQLCINYCNEALQQQFNRFVFKLEQQEYQQEGIEWSFIEFPDNSNILDLIEQKRVGILSILDEQCRLKTCTDTSFARTLYDKCKDNASFSATNTQKVQLTFTIHHYAGAVTYDTINFLEKNKDELPKETTELLLSSSIPFLSTLGEILNEEDERSGCSPSTSPSSVASSSNMSTGSGGQHGFRGQRSSPTKQNNNQQQKKKKSVGSQFSGQLRELRQRIDSTTPHYVRCLKPNDALVPHQFEPQVIADQLKCAGVLEAIRVSRVGFPNRYSHSEFLYRYGILSSSVRPTRLPKQTVNELMESLFPNIVNVIQNSSASINISKEDIEDDVALGMQTGYSKVFLRRQVYEALELLRSKKISKSVVTIQKWTRRFIYEVRYMSQVLAIIQLQSFGRMILAQVRYFDLLEDRACTVIQKNWKRFHAETHYFACKLIAKFCQIRYRGRQARKIYRHLTQAKQARLIQTTWRRYSCEAYYKQLKWGSVTLQCFWRKRQAMAYLKYLKREARNLGSVAKERDKYKQEALRLRQELERFKRGGNMSGLSAVGGAALSNPEVEREMARLRNEVKELQLQLAETRHAPPGVIEVTPSTRNGGGFFGNVFGKSDNNSVTSLSSYSNVIKRVIRGNGGPETSPSRRSKRDSANMGRQSSSMSLLDGDPAHPGQSQKHMRRQQRDDIDDVDVMYDNNNDESPSRRYRNAMVASPNSFMDDDDFSDYNESSSMLVERRGHDFSQELKALHEAIQRNDASVFRKMVDQSSEIHLLINEISPTGRMALHVAVLANDLKMVRTMIEIGVIVNAQDADGETPLHLCEGAPMTRLLLEQGKANPNIPNIHGICALHLAVQRRDVGSVRLLLQHGADINYADNIRWFTPIHLIALPDNNKGVVDVKPRSLDDRIRARVAIATLLCNGSENASSPAASIPDVNYQDNEGNSPLHYAVQITTRDACDLINAFVEKGANPNIANSRDQHPLLLLCHNDTLRQSNDVVFQECLHAILFQGANPNQQSVTGCTALHLSLYHRDIDSAIQLVHRGAELHLLWKKPKRLSSFWDDMGKSNEVLALDMVQDEHSLHRILAAITSVPKWAPSRPWCMHCKTALGAFGRSNHCRHCGRLVCGACCRCTLSSDYFPKSFEIYEASWVCIVCEGILVARKRDEENSCSSGGSNSNKYPLSITMEDDGERYF